MEVGMRERLEKLRETLRLWDAFIKDAPLASEIHTQCRILINLWRSELESIDAVAKCQRNKVKPALCGVFDNLSTMRRECIGRKMEWNVGWCIDGVSAKLLTKNEDKRGWLLEVWRSDDVDIPVMPAMSYISCTKPDTVRGPHEHVEQTDIFVFLTGEWAVRLWDDRVGSKTYGVERTILVSKPTTVVVPPGVIHAYANIGQDDGLVINLPVKLYCGKLKKQTPDELRHEGNPRYGLEGMIRKVEKKWFW